MLFAVRVLLAVTFGVSSLQKALAQRDFANALATFGVPKRLRRGIASLITAGELIATALLLQSGLLLTAGLTLSVLLLIAFSAVLVRAVSSGVDADCHCFGGAGPPISWFDVVRNVGLLLAALAGSLMVIDPANAHATQLTVLSVVIGGDASNALVAAATIAVALLWAHLPQLAELVRTEKAIP